jgi:hypothetical protein
MQKIRNLFKVESNIQLLIVNIVFAVTGTASVYFAGIIINILGLQSLNTFLYWTFRILLLVPVYQILLIIVGTLFGQFTYFWQMEKKILKRFGVKF